MLSILVLLALSIESPSVFCLAEHATLSIALRHLDGSVWCSIIISIHMSSKAGNFLAASNLAILVVGRDCCRAG